MGLNKKFDVAKFLDDEELRSEVINTALNDPHLANEIVEDGGQEIADFLEDDPAFRRKVLAAAVNYPEFLKKVTEELVQELGD